jgi:membrane fusion protein, multidrug efflux system
VRTAPAVRDSFPILVELVGRLATPPGSAARLVAPGPAVVDRVLVQVGAEVARGQVLVTLDAPDLRERSAAADAVAAAAVQERDRLERLLRDGVAARRSVEDAVARAEAALAEQRLARDLLERTRVRAPLEGGVQTVAVQPGERVDAGQLLASVVDADTLDLIAAVPAGVMASLALGQAAVVMVDDMPGAHPARVVGITPAVDSIANAGQVILRLHNAGERLRPGSGGRGVVRTGVHRDVLVIPEAALVRDGDSLAVFVVGPDSLVSRRRVVPVARAAGRVEVVGRLGAGDLLVTVGALGLREGMRVVPSGTAP